MLFEECRNAGILKKSSVRHRYFTVSFLGLVRHQHSGIVVSPVSLVKDQSGIAGHGLVRQCQAMTHTKEKKTEMTGKRQFLFATDEKQKLQTSIFCCKQKWKMEICFSWWADDKRQSMIAVFPNMPIYACDKVSPKLGVIGSKANIITLLIDLFDPFSKLKQCEALTI